MMEVLEGLEGRVELAKIVREESARIGMSSRTNNDGLQDLKYQQETSGMYCRDPNCGTKVFKGMREEVKEPVKLET